MQGSHGRAGRAWCTDGPRRRGLHRRRRIRHEPTPALPNSRRGRGTGDGTSLTLRGSKQTNINGEEEDGGSGPEHGRGRSRGRHLQTSPRRRCGRRGRRRRPQRRRPEAQGGPIALGGLAMAGFKGGGGRDCGAIQEEGARFREATAERLKKGLNGATWPNQGLALLALARGVRGGRFHRG